MSVRESEQKLLTSAWPADPPVEPPTKFECVLNLKTAEKLGLKIPDKSRSPTRIE
jgi:ABC-type uncharacterized transport system substrate-binding protein